jgi:hypothetical protein
VAIAGALARREQPTMALIQKRQTRRKCCQMASPSIIDTTYCGSDRLSISPSSPYSGLG